MRRETGMRAGGQSREGRDGQKRDDVLCTWAGRASLGNGAARKRGGRSRITSLRIFAQYRLTAATRSAIPAPSWAAWATRVAADLEATSLAIAILDRLSSASDVTWTSGEEDRVGCSSPAPVVFGCESAADAPGRHSAGSRQEKVR